MCLCEVRDSECLRQQDRQVSGRCEYMCVCVCAVYVIVCVLDSRTERLCLVSIQAFFVFCVPSYGRDHADRQTYPGTEREGETEGERQISKV